MNQLDLAKKLSKEFKIPQRTAQRYLSFAFKSIIKDIIFGCETTIKGLGKFSLAKREKSSFYDISQKKSVPYKKHYALTFKVSKFLSKRLKQKTVY